MKHWKTRETLVLPLNYLLSLLMSIVRISWPFKKTVDYVNYELEHLL